MHLPLAESCSNTMLESTSLIIAWHLHIAEPPVKLSSATPLKDSALPYSSSADEGISTSEIIGAEDSQTSTVISGLAD